MSAVAITEQTRAAVDPNAVFNQGIAALRQGQQDEAIALMRRAIAVRRGQPLYHFRLGAALQQAGRLDEAAEAMASAVRLKPDSAPMQMSLGLVQMARGRRAEGGRHLVRALTVAAGNATARLIGLPRVALTWLFCWIGNATRGSRIVAARAHARIGRALLRRGAFERAVARLRRAIDTAPDLAEAAATLGEIMMRERRYGDAVSELEKAHSAMPREPRILALLGRAFSRVDRAEDGAGLIAQALSLNPDAPEALSAKGWLLYNQGEAAAALTCFERAVAAAPGAADARLGLGRCLQDVGRLDEAALQLEQAVMADRGSSEALRLLTMGTRAAPGDTRFAMVERALARGHLSPAQRVELHFAAGKLYDDIADHDRAFGHYALANDLFDVAFDAESYIAEIDALIATFTPALLARGTALGVASDKPLFIVGMPRSGTTLVEQILSAHPAVFGAGEQRTMTRYIAQLPERLGGATPYPECAALLDHDTAQALATGYLDALDHLAPRAARVTDKMPKNFLHLGLIALLLPGARVIHCRRDPMDTCLSLYFNHFQAHHPYAYNLTNLGLYYRQYERLMAHWREVLPLSLHEVRYEDLVADLEKVSRDMVAFCGLEWDPHCLAFQHSKRTVHTASNQQVRQSLYTSSVGRWQRYAPHLAPLKAALGDGTGSTTARRG